MPPEQEPDTKPAPPEHAADESDVMTLVDFIDQLDRAAFHRVLDSRDNLYRPIEKH